MEITAEHFDILEKAIQQVTNKYKGTKEQYLNGGKTDEQFRWDTLKVAEEVERCLPEGFIDMELYDYLTKDEIDEALVEILE